VIRGGGTGDGAHLRIVSGEFRIAGLLLGVPSIAAFVTLIFTMVDLRSTPALPPDDSQYLEIGKYGLVGLLNNGVKGIGDVIGTPFALAAGAATWLIVALAITALVAALFAVLLYFVGRGVKHRATWARFVGIILTSGFLLISILALTSLRRDLAPIAVLPVGLSLYTLWVLGWRFA
jgi:hypothetical protein